MEIMVGCCLYHCYRAKMRQTFIVQPPNHHSHHRARRFAQSRLEAPVGLVSLEASAELPRLEAPEDLRFPPHVPPRPSILAQTDSSPISLSFLKNPLAYIQF